MSPWYRRLARSVAVRGCVYFHAGALCRTAGLRDDLRAALTGEGLDPAVVDAADRDWAARAGDGDPPRGRVWVLWAPERVADRCAGPDVLGQVRPAVQRLLAAGQRLLIVSSRPQLLFPAPAGSSVIGDAVKFHPGPLTAADVRAACPALDPDAAARIAGFAAGSEALAQEYTRIELDPEASGTARRRRAAAVLHERLRTALGEVGPEILALLEHFVLECGLFTVAQGDVPDGCVSALEGARLARLDDGAGTVEFFAGPWRDAAPGALAAALAEVVGPPPAWRRTAETLFELERLVRLVLSRQLERERGPGWRTTLGEPGARALATARTDSAGTGCAVTELHAPFDWFLLEQLLDFAAALPPGTAGRPATGMSAADWKRLSDQLVPIRNRVSHMRLPRPGDLDTARRALRLVSVRFRAAGCLGDPAPPALTG